MKEGDTTMTEDPTAATARPSLVDIKAAATAHHQTLTIDLRAARRKRDVLNNEIRTLAAEEAEAARIVKALEGRKPKGGTS